MIYTLFGQIENKFGNTLIFKILDVGLEIQVIDASHFSYKEKYLLYIVDYIKDENVTLFGFENELERTIFKYLISLNGIGPQSARTILKNIDPNRLISFIQEGKVHELEKISGIGNKASRIISDLKGKISDIYVTDVRYQEAYDVLISMGYDPKIANKTINELEEGMETGAAIIEAIRRIKLG